MIKHMSVLSKPSGMSSEVFIDYWKQHGEIVKRLPNIRAYVQNFVVPMVSEEDRADGISETWFQDETAMHNAYDFSNVGQTVKEDQAKFAARYTGYAVDNATLLQDVALPKVMIMVSSSGMGRFEFGDFWLPWCRMISGSVLGIHYVNTNFVSRIYHSEFHLFDDIPADIFITLRFAHEADLKRALKSVIFTDIQKKFDKINIYNMQENRVL